MNETPAQLRQLLSRLIADWENEVIEFKLAEKGKFTEVVGKYISALSNEANLRRVDCAWLVYGVDNKTRKVVGTSTQAGQGLKREIAQCTTSQHTIREIYEVQAANGKRAVILQIPAAPRGIPIAWKGRWYGRNGESLCPLDLSKLEDIRNPKYAKECMTWDVMTFLNKAKLTIKGKITRTTLLLLGREEAEHFLNPAVAKIRWNLRTLENQDKDFEVFSNCGTFIPQSVEAVVLSDAPEETYRNTFLVEAMRNLNMIGTQGGGIKKANAKLAISDIMVLDKVQKKQAIETADANRLRSQGMLEGRKPNYFLSARAAEEMDDEAIKAQYIKNRSFDDAYYQDMVVNYLRTFKKARKSAFIELLQDKLSDSLNHQQIIRKISNLLALLRRNGKIVCLNRKVWVLPQ